MTLEELVGKSADELDEINKTNPKFIEDYFKPCLEHTRPEIVLTRRPAKAQEKKDPTQMKLDMLRKKAEAMGIDPSELDGLL